MSIKGITVFTFTDPLLALEHFQMNVRTYVLVKSDFRMPGLNGMELLKKVKDLNPKVSIILISAFALQDDPDIQKYSKDGVIDSFIEKPIKINRLCHIVEDEVKR